MEGQFNGGFLRYHFGGLCLEGAYTSKGLISEILWYFTFVHAR